MSRETAFTILAIVVCLLAFAVYGLFPDKTLNIEIPNTDRVSANYLESYSPIMQLSQQDENGQPAWRKLVFGDNASSTDNSTTTNLTEGIARDMVTLNALAGQNPNINPDVYMNAITENAAQQISIKDVGQIQISPDISRSNLKTYGNNAGVIFGVMFGNEQKEVKDLQTYLSTNDVSVLKNTKKLQIAVQGMCDEMKTYSTPKTMAQLHRNLLEQCYYYNDILLAFTKVDTDPTKALVALNLYEEMLKGQLALVDKFSVFFDQNNIVFGANDFGRVFNKKI